MTTLQIIIVFVIICLIQKLAAVTVIEGMQWNLYDTGKLLDYRYDFSDGRIAYVACKTSLSLNNTRECYVSTENTFNQSDKYSCNVTLQFLKPDKSTDDDDDDDRGKDKFDWSVKHLRDDKIIIKLSEVWSANVIFAVVRLSDCKISYVKIDEAHYLSDDFIIPYSDRFEVFFKNAETCGKGFCKMTVDADGKVLEKPIKFIENPNRLLAIKPVSEISSNQGFVFVNSTFQGVEYSLLKADGSRKRLSVVKNHKVHGTAVSTKYNFITVCSILEKIKRIKPGIKKIENFNSVNCTQYDKTGKVKFKTSLVKKIDDENLNLYAFVNYSDLRKIEDKILFVQNLQKGGFMLAYERIHHWTFRWNGKRTMDRNQYLSKFDPTGKQVGKDVEESGSHGTWKSLHKNEHGDLCILKSNVSEFSSISESSDEIKTMKIMHTCYNNNDFISEIDSS